MLAVAAGAVAAAGFAPSSACSSKIMSSFQIFSWRVRSRTETPSASFPYSSPWFSESQIILPRLFNANCFLRIHLWRCLTRAASSFAPASHAFFQFLKRPLKLPGEALPEVLEEALAADLQTSQIWGSCGTMLLKPSRFEF